MKRILFLLLILPLLTIAAFAQEKMSPTAAENKWTRVEAEDKEISFALPAGFLVDATTKTRDQRYRLFGFENGVAMEVKISQPASPKKYLGQIGDSSYSPNDAKVSSFDFNGVPGRNVVSQTDRYRNSVHLAFKNNFYTFTIDAPEENRAETDRFFCSIKAAGRPLYSCKETFPELNAEAVALLSLETSPKILEALKREQEGEAGKIVYRFQTGEKTQAVKDSTKRPAIVLERFSPKPSALKVDGNVFFGRTTIKLRATLLANGQIGDVTVFSIADRNSLNGYIDAVRKSKFVPAEIDGKPVDSEYTFVYTVETR